MKIGVIGTGVMGKNHIRVYNELKAVDTVYIYDIDQKSAQSIEDSYGGIGGNVYACDTLEGLVNAVDAISICVPTQFHASTVNKILQYSTDTHLLIEKPICTSIKDSFTLIRTIPKDIICGVGHIERFNPIVPEIKKIIKDPLYVEFKRHNPSSSRITDTNVVEDLMIHDIDVMCELFGKTISHIYGFGNDDICTAVGMYDEVPITLSASRKSSKKIRSIYIEMEEFTVEGNYMSQEIVIYSKPDRFKLVDGRYSQENVVEKVIVNKVEPLKEELKTFIDCINNNIPFPVSIDDAINNMLICEEILS